MAVWDKDLTTVKAGGRGYLSSFEITQLGAWIRVGVMICYVA